MTEPNQRRLVEALIGVVFIALLVLIIFLVVGTSGASKTTITNSYNTYTIQPQPTYTKPYTLSTYSKSYLVDRKPYIVDKGDYARVYYLDRDYRDLRYTDYDDGYLRYSDWADHDVVEGILGNDINKYEVTVRNREYAGGYFTVRFYFEDYYGKVHTKSITHYISARDEKRFIFKDISPDPYEYYDWWYEVIPKTKAPTRVYYSDGDYARAYRRGSSTTTYVFSR